MRTRLCVWYSCFFAATACNFDALPAPREYNMRCFLGLVSVTPRASVKTLWCRVAKSIPVASLVDVGRVRCLRLVHACIHARMHVDASDRDQTRVAARIRSRAEQERRRCPSGSRNRRFVRLCESSRALQQAGAEGVCEVGRRGGFDLLVYLASSLPSVSRMRSRIFEIDPA